MTFVLSERFANMFISSFVPETTSQKTQSPHHQAVTVHCFLAHLYRPQHAKVRQRQTHYTYSNVGLLSALTFSICLSSDRRGSEKNCRNHHTKNSIILLLAKSKASSAQ